METFINGLKRSYNFNPVEFVNDPNWNRLKDLYNSNYINKIEKSQNMPKIIHQIWLGGEMPEQYMKYSKTWLEINSTWEYRLWNDYNIEEIEMNWDIYNSISNLGQKSDYLRYHILKQFGGLYVDTDFQCLKPFDDLSYLKFYTGIAYSSKLELYIGLIGCAKNHPLIAYICNRLTTIKDKDWKEIFNTTGTYFFTRCFLEYLQKTEDKDGVVAFPTNFFYPLPNSKQHRNKDYKPFLSKESYAIHHWAVSWMK